ncbi:caspase family protein [Candidatus Bipolaricaulota bacterium]|nr:caspase family protein [Candidatus Bipolaricaulota bacterium]
MKKLLVFLVIFFLMATTVAGSSDLPVKEEYWNNLPARWKVHLTARREGFDNPLFEIAGLYFKKKVLKKFWGKDWQQKRKELLSEISKIEKEWRNRAVLLFYITPSNESGWFRPSGFTFTQNRTQYSISSQDVISIDNSFPSQLEGQISEAIETKLRSGTITRGLMAIPKGIDFTKEFKIWYEDGNATMASPAGLLDSITTFSSELSEISESPEAGSVKIEDKYALVIGISDYKHENIPDLEYSKEDAQKFYQFLISGDYEKFPKENVVLLTDQEATTGAISTEMSKLVTEVEENDLVVIYFSGHGATGLDYNNDEEDGYDEYYVTYDTDTSSRARLYSTGINDDQFGNWLTSMDSKQVVIFLDSCYSGGATKETKGVSLPGQKAIPKNKIFNDFSFENRLLFAASEENQPSWESEKLGQGVFTHFLLQGLQGDADTNQDGKIVADELYSYLKPNVSEYVEENFTSSQIPLMKGAISAPLVEKKGKSEGRIKSIIGEKQNASRGDYVLITLGKKDGVEEMDQFRVFLSTKAVEVVKDVHGKIEVIEVVGPHLSFAKITEGEFEVEAGDKVEKMSGE